MAAKLCAVDDVPAATLLLPYFEVDLADLDGMTTLFSVNNASSTAVLAHVTLWTDESVPSVAFDLYLTGFDVQTLNLRDVFRGHLPRTASAGQDPTDSISPGGPRSQDLDFSSCTGTLPYGDPALAPLLISHLRELHTGGQSPVSGRCGGLDYGDAVARGYLTVDTVRACSNSFPSAPGYFAAGSEGLATAQNVLWGDYFYVNPSQNSSAGETMVHIEACTSPATAQEVDNCPFSLGSYTFYGRYLAASAIDRREPLATTFATRYLNGGIFDGGTSLLVWRDGKTAATSGRPCSGSSPGLPLHHSDVVAFDEAENPTDLCFRGDNTIPIGSPDDCFPATAQRVDLQGSNVPGGTSPTPPTSFGWMFLNLNTAVAGGQFNPIDQAWVTTVMDADQRFTVGFDAIQLESACNALSGGGPILLP